MTFTFAWCQTSCTINMGEFYTILRVISDQKWTAAALNLMCKHKEWDECVTLAQWNTCVVCNVCTSFSSPARWVCVCDSFIFRGKVSLVGSRYCVGVSCYGRTLYPSIALSLLVQSIIKSRASVASETGINRRRRWRNHHASQQQQYETVKMKQSDSKEDHK